MTAPAKGKPAGARRVYIAYTGGTIGMMRTPRGYAPAAGYLAENMAAMPELKSEVMPAYDLSEYDPLLDSSNVTPDDWLKIARDIAAHYREYDGFVVIHGTDTMAYTASALAFMLQGLRKPVILTGSQLPLVEVRNDARENLITAMMVAADCAIPEVCVYFGGRLLRGCRTVKVDADGFQAFDSPDFPLLGTAGVEIEITWQHVLPPPTTGTALQVKEMIKPKVGALRLFPGISPEIVANVLRPPLQGLVLEAYGAGNGPDRDQRFIAALKEGADRGVVIVDCTQCLTGTVNLGAYATGNALARVGVVSGFDMTAEAALTKMFYLFSQNLDARVVREQMQTNLRGELTPPDDG